MKHFMDISTPTRNSTVADYHKRIAIRLTHLGVLVLRQCKCQLGGDSALANATLARENQDLVPHIPHPLIYVFNICGKTMLTLKKLGQIG
jgi:hypothetical protein